MSSSRFGGNGTIASKVKKEAYKTPSVGSKHGNSAYLATGSSTLPSGIDPAYEVNRERDAETTKYSTQPTVPIQPPEEQTGVRTITRPAPSRFVSPLLRLGDYDSRDQESIRRTGMPGRYHHALGMALTALGAFVALEQPTVTGAVVGGGTANTAWLGLTVVCLGLAVLTWRARR